ncbi:hypothetical protein ABZ635_11685 [Nocardiopsis sp. NPDC007018]|uniref:hypothetical protein n=1 Tax=Nocardiopsis sp. NPDC007018 TaxID=3155721 RepID=UPI0033CC9C89
MRVCDIREAPSLSALRDLAARHHRPVHYLGPTLDARPVYSVMHAGVEWVAVGPVPAPRHPADRPDLDVLLAVLAGLRRLEVTS